MRFKLLALLCLSLLLGSAVSHATLSTITAPPGTIWSGYNWFAISGIPYDPRPEQVLAGIPIDGQLYRWDMGTQSQYAYDVWGGEFGNIVPGDRYELYNSPQAYPVSFQGFPFPADTDAWIPLGAPGMPSYIGSPLNISVPWDHLCVTDGQVVYATEDANSDYLLQAYGYSWDNVAQSQFDTGATRAWPTDLMFRPWYGYQVYPYVPNVAVIVPHDGALPYIDANNSVADARACADGDMAWNVSGVVTYVGSDFFYVEQPNRISGIRVQNTIPISVAVGDRLTFAAGVTYDSTTDEKLLYLTNLISQQSGDSIDPLGMSNKFVGGGNWNYDENYHTGQVGVTGGWGLNNIGLLATVWGKFRSIDESTFMLDDGSGTPITCKAPPGYEVRDSGGWKYITVTGVVSCYKDGSGNTWPQILARDVSDMSVLHEPSYTASASINAGTVNRYLGMNMFGNNAVSAYMTLALKEKEQPWTRDDDGRPTLSINQCVVDYASDLDLSVLRYFGGDEYHWRMGVGPVSNRPKHVLEYYPLNVSFFGTDELLEFCNLIGCESPDIVVNAMQLNYDGDTNDVVATRQNVQYCRYESKKGLGDPALAQQEAANWVEYCNGRVDIPSGNYSTVLLRAEQENWRPSKFVRPEDYQQSDPPPFPDSTDPLWKHDYAAQEWADGITCWRSHEAAPPGYFAWLRRYFAWQRLALADQYLNGEATWKNLQAFPASSYGLVDADGDPAPVKYWEVGNETYARQRMPTDPPIVGKRYTSIPAYLTEFNGEIYGSLTSSFAIAMQNAVANDQIEVGASVSSIHPDWNFDTITHLGDDVAFVTPHYYSSLTELAMETFYVKDAAGESTREVYFPDGGTFKFRVTARVGDMQTVGAAARMDLTIDGVDAAYLKVYQHPSVLKTVADSECEIQVSEGWHIVGLRNPHVMYSNQSPNDRPYIRLYRVTVEGPSLPEQSIWFPDDIEQQLNYNDYTVDGGRLDALLDLIGERDLEVYITETGLAYLAEGLTSTGYPQADVEVQHMLRHKAALWFPTFLRMLSETEAGKQVHMLCHFNLVDPGYSAVIRPPHFAGYPATTEFDSAILTPSYHMLKMITALKGSESVSVGVTSPTFTDLSGYPDAPRKSGSSCPSGWCANLPKPSGIKYLDTMACRKEGKLYVLVTNRAHETATTAFNISGASIASGTYTENVTTLSAIYLQDRPDRIVGSIYSELEAYNETRTLSTTNPTTTPDDVRATTATLNNVSGSSFQYTFPPFSITLIEFPITTP